MRKNHLIMAVVMAAGLALDLLAGATLTPSTTASLVVSLVWLMEA